jgi:hypothetical protein
MAGTVRIENGRKEVKDLPSHHLIMDAQVGFIDKKTQSSYFHKSE